MTLKDFEELIIKYISNTISSEELDMLMKHIEYTKYKTIFEDYLEKSYLLDYKQLDFTTETEQLKILESVKSKKRGSSNNFVVKRFKYVVIIFLVIGSTLLINKKYNNQNREISGVKPGINKAILRLESGETLHLDEGKSYTNDTFTTNGEKILYTRRDVDQQKVKYNYIKVPRGGKFVIHLPDETTVVLNSDSELKYPLSFTGNTREVELLYGEAFFNVSHSNKHEGKKFVVKTKEQKIEVLGTKFNLKAYPDEENIITTLVEGKIRLTNTKNKIETFLTPNQQAKLDTDKKSIFIRKLQSPLNDISWKDDFFKFNNRTLGDIMKTLSRWYNVSFVFSNNDLSKIKFSGSFSRNQNLEEIIDVIKQTEEMKFYYKNGKVYIK